MVPLVSRAAWCIRMRGVWDDNIQPHLWSTKVCRKERGIWWGKNKPVARIPQRAVSNSVERVYPAEWERAKENSDLERYGNTARNVCLLLGCKSLMLDINESYGGQQKMESQGLSCPASSYHLIAHPPPASICPFHTCVYCLVQRFQVVENSLPSSFPLLLVSATKRCLPWCIHEHVHLLRTLYIGVCTTLLVLCCLTYWTLKIIYLC